MKKTGMLCFSRKYLGFALLLLSISIITVVLSSVLKIKGLTFKTQAAKRLIINTTPAPIQQNEFTYFAILHDAYLDDWLPNEKNNYEYAINGHTICGGTVIGDDWVITAAHCFEGKDINKLRIAINLNKTQGKLNSKLEASKHFYKVEMMTPHSQFSGPPDYYNDMVLVQLDRKIDSSIQRLKIPTDQNSYNTTSPLTVVGVGCVDIAVTPGLSTPYKQGQYSLKYSLDVQKGSFNYGINTKDNELNLTNPSNVRMSLCAGDSGSPMSQGDKLLAVSYSWPTGDFSIPGVGVMTLPRNNWIQATMSTYDKIGTGCVPNTTQNYGELILQTVRSTNKKLIIINVRSKNDLYVVASVIRSIKDKLYALSPTLQVQINYSCNEASSNLFQEAMSLRDVGVCSPVRRDELCLKLENDIVVSIYKNGAMHDDISELNTQYEPKVWYR